jgi:hypothetical protein
MPATSAMPADATRACPQWNLGAGPATLLALAPILLGYIPHDQVVLIGTRPPEHARGTIVTFSLTAQHADAALTAIAEDKIAVSPSSRSPRLPSSGTAPPGSLQPPPTRSSRPPRNRGHHA